MEGYCCAVFWMDEHGFAPAHWKMHGGRCAMVRARKGIPYRQTGYNDRHSIEGDDDPDQEVLEWAEQSANHVINNNTLQWLWNHAPCVQQFQEHHLV